jgi:serine/threonine-protein phosphatase 4 regulatory subunit 1
LIKISKLIKPEHIQAKLLGVVVNLAHDDRVEEFRTIAAKVKRNLLTLLVTQ